MFFKKKKAQAAEAPMDLDAVMKKFDRESNTRIWEGKAKIVVTTVLALFSLFCIYISFFGTGILDAVRLSTFVGYIVFLGYIVFPAKKGVQRTNYMPWYDIVLCVLGTSAFIYYAVFAKEIIQQGILFEWYQLVIAAIGVLSLLELCRRSVGLPIVIVALAFVLYGMIFAFPNPKILGRLKYFLGNAFYGTQAVFSTPIYVCSRDICMVIIFGAFLERTGIADFFIKFANALVGRFSGGPAKVAVVASALEGMVSGSSIANTVGSGSVTIPLMKKTGYKPEFAAAAEASASTGGQIMPPIMGAAAFLMAENLDMPYSHIALCAIIPAVLYFAGVFISVHLEAKKEGLRGLSKQDLPKFLPLLKQLYLLLPLVVLVWLVGTNSFSITYAAAIAIVLSIIVGIFNKENRISLKKIWEALAAGAQGMIGVAAACGVAGIIAGVITMTGLAGDLLTGVVALANGQILVALVLTMLCCIVLGMGVPTTANYCIMAAICAPILVEMGVPALAAHFFVFYFGIVADLTPPVALAAYAGAAIAQANPMKTAITSTKLAIGAFIVPYVFALNPAMLLINTTAPEVVLIIITSLVGIFAVSASLEGYFLRRMPWYQRLMSLVGGLLLIYPGIVTDLIGLGLVALVAVLQIVTRKKEITA